MSWLLLGGRFCVEIAAGTIAALALVPPAPVGPPFYRVACALALVPLLLGAWLLHVEGALTTAIGFALAITVVALPFFAWPTKGKSRWVALAVAVGASSAAVVLGAAPSSEANVAARSLAAASALASGLVVGATGIAMTLGHAYLTYPNLRIDHLIRLNRATAVVFLARAALVAAAVVLVARSYEPLDRALATTGVWLGLFTRVAVGLAAPLVFAGLVASCLRHRNTRSATGILYASTVLVLIGEAVAVSMRGQAGGIPL
ncbi:MAG TPA: hypothetical protein VKE69_03810 [Planctomycetota bacterium]|nr:hypothetical protein [Planctomycetota bacterium]